MLVSASKASATRTIRAGIGISLARLSVRIALAVHALVARAGDLEHDRIEVDLLEDVLGDHRVLLHHLPLLVVERARLVEDALRDPDLADVVQEGADLDRIELVALVAEAFGERDGDVGDALRVAAGVVVLCLHRASQRADRLDELLPDLLDEPGALDRSRELGEDRVAEAVPALTLELRTIFRCAGRRFGRRPR